MNYYMSEILFHWLIYTNIYCVVTYFLWIVIILSWSTMFAYFFKLTFDWLWYLREHKILYPDFLNMKTTEVMGEEGHN